MGTVGITYELIKEALDKINQRVVSHPQHRGNYATMD